MIGWLLNKVIGPEKETLSESESCKDVGTATSGGGVKGGGSEGEEDVREEERENGE